ncbi:MAG: SAM-dependent methyltransferase [Gammaproteobacteria bacterium]|nr:SAM-dependent methyltransferase [Gammaproteobacteria bacterium]
MNIRSKTMNSLEKQLLQLPVPDEDAQRHSRQLIRLLGNEIEEQGGRISFERYMSLALTAPGLGYYVAGNQKLGARGDFVTAPEISSLYSRCLARQCAQVLTHLASSGEAGILEFGAGSGIMAADILLELERLDTLPSRYSILEVSGELKHRQKQTLQQKAAHLMDRVHWLDSLPPPGFRGVILANEVLDALPVHLFFKENDRLGEFYVAWNGERFIWEKGDFSNKPVAARVNELSRSLPDSYRSEINLAMDAWIASVAGIIGQAVVLIIDYGFPHHEYYHPQRDRGTLMCHYRHRSHGDPFVYPGLQDITAHVDFTAVAEAAHAAGLQVAGYTTQAMFLLANGLENMPQSIDVNDPEFLRLARQIKILTMPGEMGELFKVIALNKGCDLFLQGFYLQDLRGRL